MKIGLFTEFSYPGKSEQQTYAEVLEQIALADALGYDFFSITESYGKDLFSCSPFPLGLYVGAAQQASRIRFLTGIISMPIHHPAMLASQVAAADLLTNGRIMVGIGRGHPWVINRLGVNPTESAARFEEGIRMLVEIFKGEYIENLDGEFWQLRDFKLSPMPVQRPHPPIYITANRDPESFNLVGSRGHHLMTLPWIATNEEQGPRVKMYQDALRAADHSVADKDVFTMYPVYVGETDEQAKAEVVEHWHRWRGFALEATGTLPGTPAFATRSPHLSYDAMVRDSRGVFGCPESCVRILRRIIDTVGTTHIGLTFHFGGLSQDKVLKSMERCAKFVLPGLR